MKKLFSTRLYVTGPSRITGNRYMSPSKTDTIVQGRVMSMEQFPATDREMVFNLFAGISISRFTKGESSLNHLIWTNYNIYFDPFRSEYEIVIQNRPTKKSTDKDLDMFETNFWVSTDMNNPWIVYDSDSTYQETHTIIQNDLFVTTGDTNPME